MIVLFAFALCALATPPSYLTQAGEYVVENLSRDNRVSSLSFTSSVNKFLLHTIEGSGGPCDWEGGITTLDQHNDWPHFIVALDCSGKLRIGQFLSLRAAARALRPPANTLGCIQVEIGGLAAKPFTDPTQFSHSGPIVSGVSSLYAALVQVFPSISTSLDSRVHFGGSECAGTGSPCRVSVQDFIDISGLVGHQTAPSNTHWDPGHIDASVLINAISGSSPVGGGGTPSGSGGSNSNSNSAPASPVATMAQASTMTTCTYHGSAGVCTTSGACAELGGQLASSAQGANGCQALPAAITCCYGGAVPAPAPAPPAQGPPCSFKGRHGVCVTAAACSGVSVPPRRGATGCQSFAADILCCVQGVSPFENLDSVAVVSSSAGLPIAAIAGGAAAALVVLVVAVLLVFFFVVRPARARASAITVSNDSHTPSLTMTPDATNRAVGAQFL